MRTTETIVAEYPVEQHDQPSERNNPAATPAAAQLVTILSIEADGTPIVDVGDRTRAAARLGVSVTRARLETAIATRQHAVVVFENGDRTQPIIVGLIEPPQPVVDPEMMPFIDVDADGRRLRVTAQDEIVLQCGQASITLRRNGRVIVRGTYVETHSEGTNRIKGGQVQIN